MGQWNNDDDHDDDEDRNNNQLARENLVHNTTEQLRSICSKSLNVCNFRQGKFL